MKTQNTNAMRLLDSLKLPYEAVSYPSDGMALEAARVAELLNEPPERVFKTLVLLGSDKKHYICLLPGPAELDLKAAPWHEKKLPDRHRPKRGNAALYPGVGRPDRPAAEVLRRNIEKGAGDGLRRAGERISYYSKTAA